MPFTNVYHDETRARAYADLEFPGTYYLAFRDLPALFGTHVSGKVALDFGCGAGRSTRFLRELGFEVVGVDISQAMLSEAVARDPHGHYLLVPEGDLNVLEDRTFDLVFSAFTFDNIPSRELRHATVRQLEQRLSPAGCMVNLVSAPAIYVNEWLSFSTRDFAADNRSATSGDPVKIVMLDVPDRRPVEDIFWTHEDYLAMYGSAGLGVVAVHRPLGRPDDPYPWVSESAIAPWTIYVLQRLHTTPGNV